MTLVSTNESNEKIKENEELWSKIRELIRSVTEKVTDFDKIYMEIKFNSADELPLNKMIEIPIMIIVVSAIFLKITNIIIQKFF